MMFLLQTLLWWLFNAEASPASAFFRPLDQPGPGGDVGESAAPGRLVPLAEELGLDRTAFAECLKSERYAGRVAEDFEEGQSIGINGTPGNILLNNETGEVRVKSGAVPYASLKAEIDQMLQ